MEWLPANALTILAGGGLIGFLLGLLGGGGSLLAVPFLLQFGGMASPHLAIGTSAVAVACNALFNGLGYAREGMVAWRTALLFGATGGGTALLGAMLGLSTPAAWLMTAFGLLVMVVAGWMWFRKEAASAAVHASRGKILAAGGAVGGLAGFFGIGGGFLVVPALLWASGMDMRKVMGTSLFGVAVLGFGTAATYAWARQVDWAVAALMLLSGIAGGHLGRICGGFLHGRNKQVLQRLFAVFMLCIGAWMVWQNALAF